MYFDKSAGQCQSQTRALVLSSARGVHLLELPENALLVFLFYANTRVSNGYAQRLTHSTRIRADGVFDGSGHKNLPAVRCELDGVAEQIIHDLLELYLLTEQRWQI